MAGRKRRFAGADREKEERAAERSIGEDITHVRRINVPAAYRRGGVCIRRCVGSRGIYHQEDKQEETEMTKVVIVNQSGNFYLFETPKDLKAGDAVRVDTRRGRADGVCATESFEVDCHALKILCGFMRGTLPLKKVIGRYELKSFGEETA